MSWTISWIERSNHIHTYIYIYTYQLCCDDDFFSCWGEFALGFLHDASGDQAVVAHPNLLGFQIYVAYVFKDILGIYWGCIWDINVLTYYINIYYNTDTYTLGYLGSWSPISFFRGEQFAGENSLNGWFVLVQALTKRKNGFHPRKSATCMNTMKFLHEIHDVSWCQKQDSPFETLKRYPLVN